MYNLSDAKLAGGLLLFFLPLFLWAAPPGYESSLIEGRLAAMRSAVDIRYTKRVRADIQQWVERDFRSLERIIGRSTIYFPIFQSYFDRYQIPLEFQYLAAFESSLNPSTYSLDRQSGLWQLSEEISKQYDLTITEAVDERMDIHKASSAASQYLRDLFQRYQDWTLVIIAYKFGSAPLDEAIQEAKSRDYWKLRKHLDKAARHYIEDLTAFEYSMHYYLMYDLHPNYPDYPLQLTQATQVNQAKTFEQIVSETGIEGSILAKLNPGFKQNRIPSSETGYWLTIPIIGQQSLKEMEYLGYLPTE